MGARNRKPAALGDGGKPAHREEDQRQDQYTASPFPMQQFSDQKVAAPPRRSTGYSVFLKLPGRVSRIMEVQIRCRGARGAVRSFTLSWDSLRNRFVQNAAYRLALNTGRSLEPVEKRVSRAVAALGIAELLS